MEGEINIVVKCYSNENADSGNPATITSVNTHAVFQYGVSVKSELGEFISGTKFIFVDPNEAQRLFNNYELDGGRVECLGRVFEIKQKRFFALGMPICSCTLECDEVIA